jgi:hypothetical protein
MLASDASETAVLLAPCLDNVRAIPHKEGRVWRPVVGLRQRLGDRNPSAAVTLLLSGFDVADDFGKEL